MGEYSLKPIHLDHFWGRESFSYKVSAIGKEPPIPPKRDNSYLPENSSTSCFRCSIFREHESDCFRRADQTKYRARWYQEKVVSHLKSNKKKHRMKKYLFPEKALSLNNEAVNKFLGERSKWLSSRTSQNTWKYSKVGFSMFYHVPWN